MTASTATPESISGLLRAAPFLVVVVLLAVSVGVVLQPLYTVAVLLGLPLVVFLCSARRLKYGLYFLAVYTPFEPFLLNFVPERLYFPARFAHYGLIAACFAVVLARRLLSAERLWIRTPMDIPLFLFLLICGVSMFVNEISPNEAAVGLQPFLRFIVLGFYLVLYIDFNERDTRTLTRMLLVVVFLESLIGIAQSAIGVRAGEFLAPRGAEFGEAVVGGATQVVYGRYQIFATMGRYQTLGAFLGMFLLLSYPFYKRATHGRWGYLVLYAAALPCLALTASRGPWLGALVGFWVLMALRRRPSAVVLPLLVGLGVVLVFTAFNTYVAFVGWDEASSLQRVLEVFSPTYWRVAFDKAGRLYYATYFFADVFRLGWEKYLLGFGPGSLGYTATGVFGRFALSPLGIPHEWQNYVTDVNWAYLFGQTGMLGLACVVAMCVRLAVPAYRTYHGADDPFRKDLCLGFLALFALFMTTAFFYPVFEIRALSFYFWLYAGIMVKQCVIARERRDESSAPIVSITRQS